MVGPLQGLASGAREDAGRQLVESVTAFAGHRWVQRHFVKNYLADVGDEGLIGQVAVLIATAPERPFAYARAYPSGTSATAGVPGASPPVDDEADDEDFPF